MAFDIVVIGTSLGGLSALRLLLGGLPKTFPVPVAIVQHRHKSSDQSMSQFLQDYVMLPVQEVEDKDEIRPGHVYIAPADYHLLVEPGYFTLSTDAPVSYARPSIDVLFESAADTYSERVIGVILTGANQDGAQGLARIKAAGGLAIVQMPTTAESPIMPEAALTRLAIAPPLPQSNDVTHKVKNTVVDWILPLLDIAPHLIDLCQPARK